jgi:DNA (cytosine-5)-methyltransferase 1
LAKGEVDERSITEVQPDDLLGFDQCHFFAGIGGWAYAARLAGWPDDRPLWTGSCPCQPFSVAGKGGGVDDSRHLWPDFHRLISARRPPVVMGEQVAGSAGYGWFDGVRADLVGENYASRAVDFPACAVDAPHIRNRLYWVALADTKGIERGRDQPERRQEERAADGRVDARGDLGNAIGARLEGQRGDGDDGTGRAQPAGSVASADGRNGTFWADADWLRCHDGKARRSQPGTPLLVDGLPGRVAAWRGFGNAIVPQVAAQVIGAFMDCAP